MTWIMGLGFRSKRGPRVVGPTNANPNHASPSSTLHQGLTQPGHNFIMEVLLKTMDLMNHPREVRKHVCGTISLNGQNDHPFSLSSEAPLSAAIVRGHDYQF